MGGRRRATTLTRRMAGRRSSGLVSQAGLAIACCLLLAADAFARRPAFPRLRTRFHSVPRNRIERPLVPAPRALGPDVTDEPTDVTASYGPAALANGDVGRGSEVALALGPAAGDGGERTDLVVLFNPAGEDFLFHSIDAGLTWQAAVFPAGSEPFTGAPADPWLVEANTPGSFFAAMLRRNPSAPEDRSVVVAFSDDHGMSWRRAFDVTDEHGSADREMFDVDRTTERGGGVGARYDGTLYIGYDIFDRTDPNRYRGSSLRIVPPSGTAVTIPISEDGGQSHGGQVQPLGGANDGQVFVSTVGSDQSGKRVLRVYEINDAGQRVDLNDAARAAITFDTVGQSVAGTGYFVLNGFRTDVRGFLSLDRSRGILYQIYNPNPHPGDVHHDQGDIGLAVSSNGGLSWSSTTVPVPESDRGKTQYFPMLDVDDEGWLHVAYYQNESGSVDRGVYNAREANVYYTVSKDRGHTWIAPIRISDTPLVCREPPNLPAPFYLIGDYQQIRAARTRGGTTVHICWTHYDATQSPLPRVICSRVTNPTCGDGRRDPGEACDAGAEADACCTATCEANAGVACDPRRPCSKPGVCGSAGTCVADRIDFADTLAALEKARTSATCADDKLRRRVLTPLGASERLTMRAESQRGARQTRALRRARTRLTRAGAVLVPRSCSHQSSCCAELRQRIRDATEGTICLGG